VPGDPSSAAFLVAACAVTGAALTLTGVGLNPTRLGFLAVLRRMGLTVAERVTGEELGEPVGELAVTPAAALDGTVVGRDELPAVIDEVPALAAVAAHARSGTRFEGAGELRVKESDRLNGIAAGLTALGGAARADGDDLVIGGGGLAGGTAASRGDHRLAMAFVVAALAAGGPCAVEGTEAADVSYPGFGTVLSGLGADLEVRQ
jgi:3-phosphoshikimate 1-carboxyvinyltransferase